MPQPRTPGLLDRVRTRWRLRRCASVGPGTLATGEVWCRPDGEVRLGARVLLDAAVVPIELYAGPGAVIAIGDDVTLCGGSSIDSHGAVTVGDGVHLGPFSKILDNHFHLVSGDRLQRPASKPIVIGAGARIGARAVLLPGARIGDGAWIGPGAVVSRPIPAGARVGGLPLQPSPLLPRAEGAR